LTRNALPKNLPCPLFSKRRILPFYSGRERRDFVFAILLLREITAA